MCTARGKGYSDDVIQEAMIHLFELYSKESKDEDDLNKLAHRALHWKGLDSHKKKKKFEKVKEKAKEKTSPFQSKSNSTYARAVLREMAIQLDDVDRRYFVTYMEAELEYTEGAKLYYELEENEALDDSLRTHYRRRIERIMLKIKNKEAVQ